MRRINGVTAVLFGALLFSSCSDLSETLVPDVPDGGDSNASGPLADINDGTTDGRPYFFFLNPFLQSKLKPSDVGVFDPTLEPTVTICPIASWDSAAETCSSDPEVNDAGALTGFPAVYPFDPTGTGDGVQLVLSAEKYQVVYKSGNYAMVPGRTYRVAVFIFGQALGWADMAVYDAGVHGTDVGPGDFFDDPNLGQILLLNGTENQNISFRIDDGALEAQFCDPNSIEDCDVAYIDPAQGGILRVFDDGDGPDGDPNNPVLGAFANIPTGILGSNGQPYSGKVPFVMELEFNNTPQPSELIPGERQYPYFIDVWTPVDGLYFDEQTSPGVHIIVCQEETGAYSVPEGLHAYLILFLVRTFSDGSTYTQLLPTSPGAEECEGYMGQVTASHDHGVQGGLFSRVAATLSGITKFFRPKPLFAKRRVHGGLNTVVWDVSGSDGPPAAGVASYVSGLEPAGTEPELLQFGSVVTIDPAATSATISVPNPGYVGETSTITIQVLDKDQLPFLFETDVTVDITGANPTPVGSPLVATYDPNTMVYTATYTPTTDGNDTITVTVAYEPYFQATVVASVTSEIRLVKGPLTAQVKISGSSAAFVDGYPIELYDAGGSPIDQGTTVVDPNDASVGVVTFANVTYGPDYFVHLAKRDFDVHFPAGYTQKVTAFSKTTGPVVFQGVTFETVPSGSLVHRLGDDGTGNLYEWVNEGRSWTAANNQVRDYLVDGVAGHLATVYNLDGAGNPNTGLNGSENAFIADFLTAPCSGTKQCKVRGWLGLTDEAVEGTYVWVTGQVANWFNWGTREPSTQKENYDHVEIAPDGYWNTINGASSTNDGYFVEWDTPSYGPNFGGS